MSKEICISSTPHETRLAILEDDQLAEIYYERENEYTLAGSIYKGRVTRVLPGMQSAFVEVGLERDAFLYVTDFLEEQGDSADFERVANGAPRRDAPPQPSGDRDIEEAGAPRLAQASSDALPEKQVREQGREQGQRSRGRGRNRGRGDSRPQSGRVEQPAPVASPAPIEPFDSAGFSPAVHPPQQAFEHVTEIEIAPHSAAAYEEPADASGDEESPEGTRRWRGRRGRRGGSAQRPPREQNAAHPARQPAATPESISGPERTPDRVLERISTVSAGHAVPSTAAGTSSPSPHVPSIPAPIVLPGESLSKYAGSSQASQPRSESTGSAARSQAPAAAPSSAGFARPSTLIEAPLSWDGSGLLPGETISRYRKPDESAREDSSSRHRNTAESESEASDVSHAASVAEFDSASEPIPEAADEGRSGTVSTEALSPIEATAAPQQRASAKYAEHSAFESAYEARETDVVDGSAVGQPEPQGAGGAGAQVIEEFAEFEPTEASASHRVDAAAPSEFRMATPVEDETETPAERAAEAAATFQAVVPDEFVVVEFAHPAQEEMQSPSESGYDETLSSRESLGRQEQLAHRLSTSEPESLAERPATENAASPIKPQAGSFWQSVKDLVIGHSAADEEPRSPHETGPRDVESLTSQSAEVSPVQDAGHDAPEQSPAQQDMHSSVHAHGFSRLASEPAPPEPESRFMQEEDPDEAIFDVPHSDEPLFGETSSSTGSSEAPEIDPKEQDGSSQSFAPGSGLIEEETIEEEEYDFEPIHAHSDDHDLEDLEEETLQQGGVELGEMVRDAHLEQRVKGSTADGVAEEEAGETWEDGSGGYTEEDFTEQVEDEEDEEEDLEADAVAGQTAGQTAAGASTPTDRNGSSNDRNGDPRTGTVRVDRGSDRSRGRGRRPGHAGSHGGGNRRQNTQAADLPVISELLKQGQEILVQIAKEPIAKKGARITSHIALPGRFLVFMPTVNHVGVSRKISSDEERQRLKRILISEKGAAAGGFIVRTAADGAGEEDLRADIRFLLALWNEIKQRSDEAKAPALIYHDLNLIERVLRDQVSDNFSAIWVDSETEYERIVRFLQRFQPSLVRRVKLYTKETPLFEQFGIQEEISKALKSKVWLKSGGSIVINQTEALVAIDINTGKFVGKTTRLEDTILRTNLDAIPEIVRQIRLRDLGGIIVIDFIDMDERKNRNRVMQALEDELKHDRAPSKVLQFNDFGLVAITRKRVKQSLERTLSVQCEVCTGTGMVKSPTTVCNEIYTEMRKMHRTLERKDVLLRVHPEVVKSLKSTNGRWLNELEEMTGKTIIVKSDPVLHPEQFDIH